jgi:hypothetical protein
VLAEPGNRKRRTIFVRLSVVLVILASFLVYVVLLQSGQVPPGPGPSVAIDVGLLVTVVLCVSISFWVTFAGEAKDWKRGALLFAGLICASGMFFLLSFLGMGLVGFEISYPAAYNNIYLAGRFMLVIAIILGLAAVLALVLSLHSFEVAEARARLQQSR